MVFLPQKTRLTNKLSILLIFSMLLTLTLIGVYFEHFLRNDHLATTKRQMSHGFERLNSNLNNIQTELKDGTLFVRNDETFVASIELINNYQNKDDYSVILIDEEKKNIAQKLLERVKLSFNSAISLYDKNGELIAFVVQEPKGFKLNYISYENRKPVLYSRYEHDDLFTRHPLKVDPFIPIQHTDLYAQGTPTETPVITYGITKSDIVIKSHLNIIDKITSNMIAHVELAKVLNKAYFQEFSREINMNFSYSMNTQYSSSVLPLSSHEQNDLAIVQTDAEYVAIKKIQTNTTPIYIIAKLDKTFLKEVLNENRWQLLLLLFIIALVILLITRYLFRRTLEIPMNTLMEQINRIEHEDYSTLHSVHSGDELELISRNITKLAETVQEREHLLRQSKHELMDAKEELEKLNANLQSEVQRQIEEIRHKDEILIQQSKQAAMGEMIGNIAHQWRQPLNSLGLKIQGIEDAYNYNEMDKEYVEKMTTESMYLIQHMSKTIDDFRNFFAPQKEKKDFHLLDVLGDIQNLVAARMRNHRITLTVAGEDMVIFGFSNEFKQAIINIINNAADAIMEQQEKGNIQEGFISIELHKEVDCAKIKITDNGGGISEDIIAKVFDPYFTTKFQSQGTGIGLYMCKTIIEKNMSGKIDVSSVEDKTVFSICLPLAPQNTI